jgi:hypothetical protein
MEEAGGEMKTWKRMEPQPELDSRKLLYFVLGPDGDIPGLYFHAEDGDEETYVAAGRHYRLTLCVEEEVEK